MDLFTIISVWHHKNEFIFNNSRYPFLHNAQYHANKYNYTILYLIEDETDIIIPNNDNINYINFKNMFPDYLGEILSFHFKSNKIDFMKNIIIKENERIGFQYIFFMDLDCEIEYFNIYKLEKSNNFITAYHDISVERILELEHGVLNSYIENYAFLINKNNSYNVTDFKNVVFKSEATSNCFMYEQYLNLIIKYYQKELGYKFPRKSNSLDLKTEDYPILVNFERGSTWYEDFVMPHTGEYIYNMTLRPIYNRDKYELYMNILSQRIDLIIANISYFIKIKYDFKSKFGWSNSLQSYVNLYGVLLDRIEDVHSLNKILNLNFYQCVEKFEKK